MRARALFGWRPCACTIYKVVVYGCMGMYTMTFGTARVDPWMRVCARARCGVMWGRLRASPIARARFGYFLTSARGKRAWAVERTWATLYDARTHARTHAGERLCVDDNERSSVHIHTSSSYDSRTRIYASRRLIALDRKGTGGDIPTEPRARISLYSYACVRTRDGERRRVKG